jgi:hypothetical protein
MPNQNYETLKDAIARNCGAVLALPSTGMIRHHKTRFLAETENGFWIEAAGEADRALVDSLMAEEAPVGVAFKAGAGSVVFAAPIRAREERFHVNDETVVKALFLPFPDGFRQLQRRQAYRVTLPAQSDVGLRLWRISEHAILRDRPMAAQEIPARLQNVSVLGAGAICGPCRDGAPPKMLVGERMRIQLTWDNQDLLTEGRVIHFRLMDPKRVAMGTQFKKLEKDFEGRQAMSKLTELVGVLQRSELQRRRAVAVD